MLGPSLQEILQAQKRNLALIGSCIALLALTGCGEEPRPVPSTNYSIDRDNDGIPNSLDRNPDIHDGIDADNDGQPNTEDLLYPYDPTNGRSTAPSVPSIPQVPTTKPESPSTTLPCMRGYGPDYDRDGKPDHCDPIIGDRDSDLDGLPDREDTAPYNADGDNDGTPDGQDNDPSTSKKQEEDRLERERQDRQREEDRQREKDLYD